MFFFEYSYFGSKGIQVCVKDSTGSKRANWTANYNRQRKKQIFCKRKGTKTYFYKTKGAMFNSTITKTY